MSNDGVDYGPLAHLIGSWAGSKGLDVSPEPDGTEENPYYETIRCEAAGSVENAESQTLAIVRYHQVVSRKSNDEVFHDQIGYWTWDSRELVVAQSIVIPRVVAVLAGGRYTRAADARVIELAEAAGKDDPDWGIIQSPFMRDKARTVSFRHQLSVEGDVLRYSETTGLEIYGRHFDHTDKNELSRDG